MAAMPPKNGAPKGMRGPMRPNVGLAPKPIPRTGVMPHNNGLSGGQAALQEAIRMQAGKKMMGR